MTLGIVCTVVIAIVALYQTLAARAYRDSVAIYRSAMVSIMQSLERTRDSLVVSTKRIQIIADALPTHRDAADRGDAKACSEILYAAIADGNAIKEPPT